MDTKYFKSDNPEVLARAVQQAVYSDSTAEAKTDMRTGIKYYNHEHDILHYRLFYVDNEGKLHEETSRSNITIPHSFFTELVDQKVQYLLSNPIEIKTEVEGLQDYLDEYIDEDFQLTLQEVLEGASQKGYDFVYVKKTGEGLQFKPADSLKVIEIYDEDFVRIAIIRYYDTDIYIDGKNVRVTRAELWDEEKTWYFVNGGSRDRNFKLDTNIDVNPLYHETLVNPDTNEAYGRGLGFIPFFRLDNNKAKKNDLAPIKKLIDDYDLMACALSNNLQDFDQPFFAVKNFNGDSYENLLSNLRSRGAVGVGENGGLDMHVVDIPVNARKTKLDVDKEGIYKFGMGFDSSQTGDGNITNVVIQSRYSLLDLKCNKSEIRLRQLIKKMLEVIIEDINTRHGKAYKTNDVSVTIKRDTMINETEVVEREQKAAVTQGQQLNNILDIAARLDDETVLKAICDILELDYEEIQKKIGEQDYQEPIEEEETEDEDQGLSKKRGNS